jgi:hypothetical protein
MITGRLSAAPAVEEELRHLPDLTADELKARWLQLKGVPLPKFMRRKLITLAVAHAIEEAAHGGLDPHTRKRLDDLAARIVPAGTKPPPRLNRIKPGTRLVREWNGRVHDVMVLEDGFAWQGKRYASLSAIARSITGTRWNGWMFFGLKQREAAKEAATASTREQRAALRRPRSSMDKSRDIGSAAHLPTGRIDVAGEETSSPTTAARPQAAFRRHSSLPGVSGGPEIRAGANLSRPLPGSAPPEE